MSEKRQTVIERNAVMAETEDPMTASLWAKIKKLIEITFDHIKTYARAQGLEALSIVKGPFHFKVILDEEKLVIFFGIRPRNELQRVYVEDIREHSIVSIDGSLRLLPSDEGIHDPESITFHSWEFENINKMEGYARVRALEFLTKVSRQQSEQVLDPFQFPSINVPIDKKLAFVLMPFSEPWSTRIWQKHLRPIIKTCGLIARRADDLYGPNVVQDIWRSIKEAGIIYADVTNRNPNVYYELGIAHAIGKPVIVATQSPDDIPFDLRSFRHVIYQDNSDGYDVLQKVIPEAIKYLLRR